MMGMRCYAHEELPKSHFSDQQQTMLEMLFSTNFGMLRRSIMETRINMSSSTVESMILQCERIGSVEIHSWLTESVSSWFLAYLGSRAMGLSPSTLDPDSDSHRQAIAWFEDLAVDYVFAVIMTHISRIQQLKAFSERSNMAYNAASTYIQTHIQSHASESKPEDESDKEATPPEIMDIMEQLKSTTKARESERVVFEDNSKGTEENGDVKAAIKVTKKATKAQAEPEKPKINIYKGVTTSSVTESPSQVVDREKKSTSSLEEPQQAEPHLQGPKWIINPPPMKVKPSDPTLNLKDESSTSKSIIEETVQEFLSSPALSPNFKSPQSSPPGKKTIAKSSTQTDATPPKAKKGKQIPKMTEEKVIDEKREQMEEEKKRQLLEEMKKAMNMETKEEIQEKAQKEAIDKIEEKTKDEDSGPLSWKILNYFKSKRKSS